MRILRGLCDEIGRLLAWSNVDEISWLSDRLCVVDDPPKGFSILDGRGRERNHHIFDFRIGLMKRVAVQIEERFERERSRPFVAIIEGMPHHDEVRVRRRLFRDHRVRVFTENSLLDLLDRRSER